jgi:hypothetical protein
MVRPLRVSRKIQAVDRLVRYGELLAKYVAEGMDREQASRKAYGEVLR